ncbi:hypothetical protein [Bradyrhizobium erythrophlei]|jgi:hypothetical protein|uniref:Uncharacterized protein n=1 Tax=Bradyrhizobium erythrophlei TaxID=1437360 RepID=A0A1M7UFV2_9BRAD|nr:hypothetical protein [Bradyrhizobium erythrophlei]SHN81872.1 hypothetical protein SAMN05444170_4931 [Bradyrhizobium erythrophlei]
MISLVIGLSNLGIGIAYAGLGLLAAWETASLHRYRGWSRFGLGFSLMAASCGPHHLVHGWHVLQGGSISWPMLAATVIGLPAGLTFVGLRLERMWGGQGERVITASADRVAMLAGVFALATGLLAAGVFVQPAADALWQVVCTSSGLERRASSGDGGVDFTSLSFVTNIFVTVTYGMVGWYLADFQVRRYLTTSAWSLSGVSLTGVFFTCALMHLVDASTHGDGAMLFFDLLGIPASIYFLWVVKLVHNDSVMDWNRRPLVGAAASPARPSPWSGYSL